MTIPTPDGHGEGVVERKLLEQYRAHLWISTPKTRFSLRGAGATASAKLYSLVETAEANQLEPHACLSLIFTRLPTLTKVEDYEVLLRWNARTGLASFTARPVERRNAIA